MGKFLKNKTIGFFDLMPITLDLGLIANQNSRIIRGLAQHIMGEPREMRIDFGPEYGGVHVFLPVEMEKEEDGSIVLFKNVHNVPKTWRPWKKHTFEGKGFKLVDIKVDDPILDEYREGLTIV